MTCDQCKSPVNAPYTVTAHEHPQGPLTLCPDCYEQLWRFWARDNHYHGDSVPDTLKKFLGKRPRQRARY